MAIVSLNTDQAQSVANLADVLGAFLELSKDAKKWKSTNEEVASAANLVKQAKEVDDKLRQVQNGLAKIEAIGAETEALKLANAERQADLDKREMAIQPREQGVEKREAQIVVEYEALAKKQESLDKSIAKAEKKAEALEASIVATDAQKETYAKLAADAQALIEKYNQAIANLQAAQV